MKKLSPSCAGVSWQSMGRVERRAISIRPKARAFRTLVRRQLQPLAIHAPQFLWGLFLQKLDPVDQRRCLVAGDIIAGDHIHAAVILRHHHDPEGRLLTFVGARLRALHAISDDVLHQFDKDREDVPDLRSVAGMILQALTQGVADGEEYVL